MVTEWLKIDGYYYYFGSSGAITKNAWVYTMDHFQYLDNYGHKVFGWQQIGGTWYFFDKDGFMKTGWLTYNGNLYYLNSSGAMVTGKQLINNKYEYFNAYGILIKK